MSRLSALGHFLETFAITALVEAGLLGIYFGLLAFAVAWVLTSDTTLSPARFTTLLIAVVMFAVAAVHWISHTILSDCQALPGGVKQVLFILLISTPTVNSVLCGMMILWRTWLLWEKSRVVLEISAGLLLINVGAVACLAVVIIKDPMDHTGLQMVTKVALICSAISITLWSTAMVGYKAWYGPLLSNERRFSWRARRSYRRFIKRNLGEGVARTRASDALVLLFESGCIMNLALVLVLLSDFGVLFAMNLYINSSSVHVTGIHTTVLIIVTWKRLTQPELQPLGTPSGPARPPPGTTPEV
ncbi:hypothetical protein BC834DRAFT_581749 [Gloeopeniophorella convolvens]|nr:hypothetical protein BC834DRAFT_581749 [Gloeopeniophorella convolvens]